ncbi:hypothetical protein CBR_g23961 [Chara braunii]|uniref:Uncharacterized protein n=1 Tax=Chara braunii TaxID=69332 RepID=A0A388L5E4_CHABU|nr:hypothetical protein CBR_g23961 [Chara braunii]|eukprot:GBG77517.1 hypothetical protein CBR_g23961 [Chara braunii]
MQFGRGEREAVYCRDKEYVNPKGKHPFLKISVGGEVEFHSELMASIVMQNLPHEAPSSICSRLSPSATSSGRLSMAAILDDGLPCFDLSSVFAPLRLNGNQGAPGAAPTPLLTLPPNNNSGVGTVAPALAYSGQSNGGGWLGKRAYTLEERVAKISQRHEAEEAKEKAWKEEEERMKRKQEEDDRLMREKKERDEFQHSIKQKLAESLNKVYSAIDGKKRTEPGDVEQLKATVEGLQQRLAGAGTSTDKHAHDAAIDELARIRREQGEMKADAGKRLSALEDVVMTLQRQCEEAEAAAE